MVRLKEMRLEGEVDREAYRSRKAEITDVIEDLEAQLGSPEYDVEAALAQIENLGEVIKRGDPGQQRRALAAMFEHVEVSVDTKDLARIVPKPWFQLFFRDLEWCAECPWRDSNPRPTA